MGLLRRRKSIQKIARRPLDSVDSQIKRFKMMIFSLGWRILRNNTRFLITQSWHCSLDYHVKLRIGSRNLRKLIQIRVVKVL